MSALASRLRALAFTAATLSVSTELLADVMPAKIFSDHMILQRDTKVPVWGTADAGETVKVTFNGQEKTATTGEDKRWRVDLDAIPASEQPTALTVVGKNTVTINDVLVGEVWVCSGQSNMEFMLNRARNAKAEIAAANYPTIRHFTVGKKVSETELPDVTGAWQVCSPTTAGGFTAVGYFFGRELNQKLNVPVGLIHTSWGGTPAEAWTSMQSLEADDTLKPIVERYEKRVEPAEFAKLTEKYEKDLTTWTQLASTQPAATQPNAPAALRKPRKPDLHDQYQPAHLYNGMLKPLIPYAVRGVTWYQGEANAGRAEQYRTLLPTMITTWREQWNQSQKDFPFYIVQLANYQATTDDPSRMSAWAELREAQSLTAAHVPNTGVAVTIDIGEAKDIHPTNKQDVGKRLAALALHRTYGMADVVPSGPTYSGMQVNGGVVTLSFEDVGGGLVAKNSTDTKTVTGVAVAGEDKKFVWADAKISDDGKTITVSSPAVPNPVAVRYAWADNPDKANLYNKADLPASPFRTDEWPMATARKR